MNWALTYLGFFAAGLAGSLHCIGMCGPILTAIVGAERRSELTVNGRTISATASRAVIDLLWYHAGRVCTYAMLGALAGLIGERIRDSLWLGHAQQWLGVALGGAALLFAATLLLKPASGCSTAFRERSARGFFASVASALRALAAQRDPAARLLLGAIMGLIPCGLVYIMLAAVAALGHPLAAALGMIAFGLGTLPALSGVVVAVRLVPLRWRAQGNRVAMLIALVVGAMFLWRSWPQQAHAGVALDERPCPLCEAAADGGADSQPAGAQP